MSSENENMTLDPGEATDCRITRSPNTAIIAPNMLTMSEGRME